MNETHPLIYKLNNQYDWLLSLLENLDNTFLKTPPIPQKWSIQEHLAHLGRYHEIFFERLTVILNVLNRSPDTFPCTVN